ncbi:unnamed protein product [Phytophthora fragariaefolia]|uniref:Unnamed protein product n=1 Tax=Phytophthora fragariaefolia TaxID=1490495 RepID=A0A9W7CPA5_9STRA|nr:unnamed protein product [Phytophthora fragariaefolia]
MKKPLDATSTGTICRLSKLCGVLPTGVQRSPSTTQSATTPAHYPSAHLMSPSSKTRTRLTQQQKLRLIKKAESSPAAKYQDLALRAEFGLRRHPGKVTISRIISGRIALLRQPHESAQHKNKPSPLHAHYLHTPIHIRGSLLTHITVRHPLASARSPTNLIFPVYFRLNCKILCCVSFDISFHIGLSLGLPGTHLEGFFQSTDAWIPSRDATRIVWWIHPCKCGGGSSTSSSG